MAERIIYEDLGPLGQVTAEQLTWSQTEALAPVIMKATADAYVEEFTHNLDGEVPESHIRNHYDPDNADALEQFLTRTEDIHNRGARITVIRASHDDDGLLGYMKVGPAPNLTRAEPGRFQDEQGGYDYNGLYLNNILVSPRTRNASRYHMQDNWGKGVGRTLLHAGFMLALPRDQQSPEYREALQQTVVLDAFDISRRVNHWYLRLGFKPDPEIATGSMTFGGTELSQTYYSTPEGFALQGVIGRLERRQPRLQHFRREALP